jgi:hypothetical protein
MPQPLTPPPMIARSKIRSKDASPGVRPVHFSGLAFDFE